MRTSNGRNPQNRHFASPLTPLTVGILPHRVKRGAEGERSAPETGGKPSYRSLGLASMRNSKVSVAPDANARCPRVPAGAVHGSTQTNG